MKNARDLVNPPYLRVEPENTICRETLMKFQSSKLVARVLVVALLVPVFARAAVSSHGAGGDACVPSSDVYSSRASAHSNDQSSDAARIARLEIQLDSLRAAVNRA